MIFALAAPANFLTGTPIREDGEVRGLLDAVPDPELVPRTVSTAVNTVRNNHPELLAPVD